MSIRCGSCGGTHPSVAAVRACATGRTAVPVSPVSPRADSVLDRLRRQASQPLPSVAVRSLPVQEQDPATMPAWVLNAARPNAIKYATDRLRKREWEGKLDHEEMEVVEDLRAGRPVDAGACSRLIDRLGTFPYRSKETTSIPETVRPHMCTCGCGQMVGASTLLEADDPYARHIGSQTDAKPTAPVEGTSGKGADYNRRIKRLKALVPDSRYAVVLPDEDKLRFFLVTSRNGFIKIQEYASDELYPRRWSEYENILQTILEDGPENAQERFGQEIGRCYHCYRTLTDETSRRLGIGPICRSK